ncbi:MAG TPA: radical SAM protein [Spirochaetota bacterium]|nr:radical SAM protein [Spirochaetota bacterium]HOS33914.1 radical SAM protein [Spirochaetota bacterium]HOS56348.1 radical SAM protein [Spirochaetota bacterium]HQF78307.1 radical SAM protein [Spirochaetota bacterium]HQH29330.1 radical SAM protein [Spirochaetota bacterium]
MNIIYGPVSSRRFGSSLGISIVENKTCNFDCVYCELGRSPRVEYKYGDYEIPDKVIDELNLYVKNLKVNIDVLTVTGYGEPTLNRNIAEIARKIKENYPRYPTLLLTNSTHLDKKEVISSFKYFDRIIPSLDAVSEEVYQKINRPIKEITARKIIENITILRANFSGSLELEILFCDGINSSESEINLLKNACSKIKPDKVWVNTVYRNPAYPEIKPISNKLLEKLNLFFNGEKNDTFKI